MIRFITSLLLVLAALNGPSLAQADAERRKYDACVNDSYKCKEAANFGDPDAMYNLGLMYQTGRGVQRDYAQALSWYHKAAAAGMSIAGPAMNRQGLTYLKAQDDAQAVSWFRNAAAASYAPAMTNLGFMCENARGVPRDYKHAMSWYRKAAAAGDPNAMYNLGFMYENARGVPQDYARAMKWYRQAANAGIAIAMYNLGRMYENAQGVPQDDNQAASWYRKAAEAGDHYARASLTLLGQ
jgi:TPR repeat protein